MTGRYDGVEIGETQVPDGQGGWRTVRYLRRRHLPAASTRSPIAWHRVVEADRLDLLAARYLGDPLAFWRIADANRVLRADALTENTGVVIAIPAVEP